MAPAFYDRYDNTSAPCNPEAARILSEAVGRLLALLSDEDHVRILVFLSRIEGAASLRRISRNTGISYRTLSKRLEDLERAGLVEVSYERSNLRLYRATLLCRTLIRAAGGEEGG